MVIGIGEASFALAFKPEELEQISRMLAKITANRFAQRRERRFAEFVRTVVPNKNIAPNYAWRNCFKTVSIEAGIEHRILDSIQGHSSRNVAEGYGEVTIKTQAAAIAKLPRYKVPL